MSANLKKAIITPSVIFIVVPKVANTSIKVTIADWLGYKYTTNKNGPNVHTKTLFKYDSVDKLKSYSQPKIGFVRDPWSRLVSCYRNKIEGNGTAQLTKWGITKQTSFEQFINIIEENWGDFNNHWAPCFLWADYADQVIKFENINDEWNKLTRKYGVPPLPCINESGARDTWKSYYNKTTATQVRKMYQVDVKKWFSDWEIGK